MMTFEHPLGRISYGSTDGWWNHDTGLPGLPLGPGKYRHRKAHGRYYVVPDPPTLDAFTTGSLGGSIIGDRQAEVLTSVAIGAIVGAVAGSWYAGGKVTNGRSNDVWGGIIGGLVGLLTHQGITGFGPDGGTIGPEGWAP